MNRELSEAIARVSQLHDDQQQAAAALLFKFLERENELTPAQISEIERRLAKDDIATDAEVNAFFDRIKR